jgi:hypothetical protein
VPENHGSHNSDCSPLFIITDAWFKYSILIWSVADAKPTRAS